MLRSSPFIATVLSLCVTASVSNAQTRQESMSVLKKKGTYTSTWFEEGRGRMKVQQKVLFSKTGKTIHVERTLWKNGKQEYSETDSVLLKYLDPSKVHYHTRTDPQVVSLYTTNDQKKVSSRDKGKKTLYIGFSAIWADSISDARHVEKAIRHLIGLHGGKNSSPTTKYLVEDRVFGGSSAIRKADYWKGIVIAVNGEKSYRIKVTTADRNSPYTKGRTYDFSNQKLVDGKAISRDSNTVGVASRTNGRASEFV